MKKILKLGLSDKAFEYFTQGTTLPKPPPGTLDRTGSSPAAYQYFLEIRIPQDEARDIASLVVDASPGVKIHRPENFHITIMHFGERSTEETQKLIGQIQSALEGLKPFPLLFDPKDFSSGSITGYKQGKAFYFAFAAKRGGTVIRKIRERITTSVARGTSKDTFIPHLTIASTKTDVIEEVAKDAQVTAAQDRSSEVLIKKLRLTEVRKTPEDRVLYRARQYFPLGVDREERKKPIEK